MNLKKLCQTGLLTAVSACAIAGDAQTVNISTNVQVDENENGQTNAHVVIKKVNGDDVQVIEHDYDPASGQDVNAWVDEIMQQYEIEEGGKRHVIKIQAPHTGLHQDSPRLGFMANVKDNGWQVLSVASDSGAAEAGMKAGDVIVSIDGQATGANGLGLNEFIEAPKAAGQVSRVEVLRNGQPLSLQVEARVLDSPDAVMQMDHAFKWVTEFDGDFNGQDLDVMIDAMDLDNIHVVTTGDADAYFFSGGQLKQWLGDKHHFSTINDGLGKYFGTDHGVLVLEVDKTNVLGLQDGDVILSVNGESTAAPKDVVRALKALSEGDAVSIEIVRDKRTIYLES